MPKVVCVLIVSVIKELVQKKRCDIIKHPAATNMKYIVRKAMHFRRILPLNFGHSE
jgi:hypothetical protein